MSDMNEVVKSYVVGEKKCLGKRSVFKKKNKHMFWQSKETKIPNTLFSLNKLQSS